MLFLFLPQEDAIARGDLAEGTPLDEGPQGGRAGRFTVGGGGAQAPPSRGKRGRDGEDDTDGDDSDGEGFRSDDNEPSTAAAGAAAENGAGRGSAKRARAGAAAPAAGPLSTRTAQPLSIDDGQRRPGAAAVAAAAAPAPRSTHLQAAVGGMKGGAAPVLDLERLISSQRASTAAPTASTPPAAAAFIPSKKFSGAKAGYIFKKGAKGVGYYRDPNASAGVPVSTPLAPAPAPAPAAAAKSGKKDAAAAPPPAAVGADVSDGESDEEEVEAAGRAGGPRGPVMGLDQNDLIRAAFAGDDVEDQFARVRPHHLFSLAFSIFSCLFVYLSVP